MARAIHPKSSLVSLWHLPAGGPGRLDHPHPPRMHGSTMVQAYSLAAPLVRTCSGGPFACHSRTPCRCGGDVEWSQGGHARINLSQREGRDYPAVQHAVMPGLPSPGDRASPLRVPPSPGAAASTPHGHRPCTAARAPCHHRGALDHRQTWVKLPQQPSHRIAAS